MKSKTKSIRKTKKKIKRDFRIGRVIYNTYSHQCATITNVTRVTVGTKHTQIGLSLMNSVNIITGKAETWNFNSKPQTIRPATESETRRYYQVLVNP